jgi:beta-xylosidase
MHRRDHLPECTASRRIALCALVFVAIITSRASAERTYQNPLDVQGADPFVFHEGDTYYMYATSASNGLYVWTSRDLVTWEQRGLAFERTDQTWSRRHFWAPELFKHQGRYYLHFTADGGSRSEPKRRLVLAEGDSPLGPFREIKAPWFDAEYNTIDGHVFRDNDGRLYLYSVYIDVPRDTEGHAFQIHVRKLADDLAPSAESKLCITPTEKWEGGHVTEGPFVLRRGDTYYFTYSGQGYTNPNYSVGVATSKSPLGPWAKSPAGPILKRTAGVSGPGHHCFTESPDGREMFIVYHVHQYPDRPGDPRVIAIDRARFVDGETPTIEVTGPTITPQPILIRANP